MIGLLNVVIHSNLISRYQFTARNVTAIVNQIGADDNIYTNVSKLIIRERYEDGSGTHPGIWKDPLFSDEEVVQPNCKLLN